MRIKKNKVPAKTKSFEDIMNERATKPYEYFIEGDVPSKKNSKRLVTLKNGKQMAIGSKASLHYVETTEWQWLEQLKKWEWEVGDVKDKCILIELKFFRKRGGRWDYNNISQAVTDLMKTHGFIHDDDIDHLVTIPPLEGKRYEKDPLHPGVQIKFIKILES